MVTADEECYDPASTNIEDQRGNSKQIKCHYCIKVCLSPKRISQKQGKCMCQPSPVENELPLPPPLLNPCEEDSDFRETKIFTNTQKKNCSKYYPKLGQKNHKRENSCQTDSCRRHHKGCDPIPSTKCEAGIQCSTESPKRTSDSHAQTTRRQFQACGIQTSHCEKGTKDCQTDLEMTCAVVGISHDRRTCVKPCCNNNQGNSTNKGCALKLPSINDNYCKPVLHDNDKGCTNKTCCKINKKPSPTFPFVGRTPSGNFKVRPDMVTYQNPEFGILVANPHDVRTTVKKLDSCNCPSFPQQNFPLHEGLNGPFKANYEKNYKMVHCCNMCCGAKKGQKQCRSKDEEENNFFECNRHANTKSPRQKSLSNEEDEIFEINHNEKSISQGKPNHPLNEWQETVERHPFGKKNGPPHDDFLEPVEEKNRKSLDDRKIPEFVEHLARKNLFVEKHLDEGVEKWKQVNKFTDAFQNAYQEANRIIRPDENRTKHNQEKTNTNYNYNKDIQTEELHRRKGRRESTDEDDVQSRHHRQRHHEHENSNIEDYHDFNPHHYPAPGGPYQGNHNQHYHHNRNYENHHLNHHEHPNRHSGHHVNENHLHNHHLHHHYRNEDPSHRAHHEEVNRQHHQRHSERKHPDYSMENRSGTEAAAFQRNFGNDQSERPQLSPPLRPQETIFQIVQSNDDDDDPTASEPGENEIDNVTLGRGGLSEGSLEEDHFANVLPNLDTQHGVILMFGGLDPQITFGPGNNSKSVYMYTVETNTWVKVGTMPESRMNFGLAHIGNNIYIIGGTDPSKTAENGRNVTVSTIIRLNLRMGQWDLVNSLEKPRSHFGCVPIDHNIYIIGGHIDYKATTSCIVYNTITDSFKSIAPLGIGRCSMGIAIYGSGIMVAGGTTKEAGRPILETVICYDPEYNRWTPWADLPSPRAFLNLVEISNKIYLVAGSGIKNIAKRGNHSLSDILYYNDTKDEWEEVGMLRTPRHGHTSVKLGDKIVVIGGVSSHTKGAIDSVEIFSPETERIEIANSISQNKSGMAALTL